MQQHFYFWVVREIKIRHDKIDSQLNMSIVLLFVVELGSIPSMQCVGDLLFTLYRMTLVDEYDYASMAALDRIMAPLLCGSFLAASSILCVNLLIAMVTDTFQRSGLASQHFL